MKKIFLILILAFIIGTAATVPAEAREKEKHENLYYKKGYRGTFALGSTSGLVYDFGSVLTVLTSHGYSYGNGAFLGLGFGGVMSTTDLTVPIFVNFKYSFLDKRVSPFVDYKFGISLYSLTYLSGYVSPSVGIDIKNFTLSMGYVYQAIAFKDHWLNFTVAVNF